MSEQSKVPEQVWALMQQRLGYSEEQMQGFREDSRNEVILAHAGKLASKTFVFEVTHSHGCNAQHGPGQRFYFTGDGLLISKMAPARACVYALASMKPVIFAMQELIYADADPNRMTFRHVTCSDVGQECGGWGRCVLEARLMDRDEARRLHAGG